MVPRCGKGEKVTVKGLYMKKIAGKMAMFLILVMLAGSFTSCLSWWLMTGEPLDLGNVSGEGVLLLIFLPVIDVILLPLALTVCIVRAGIEAARDNRGQRFDGVDTFSATVRSLPEAELDSLMQRFNSLPESEIDSLMQRFYSLPESEIDSFTETMNSFSEAEISAMVAALNHFSEKEIASSMETLSSMPKEELVSTMNDLQHVKIRYQYYLKGRNNEE